MADTIRLADADAAALAESRAAMENVAKGLERILTQYEALSTWPLDSADQRAVERFLRSGRMFLGEVRYLTTRFEVK